MDDLRKDIRNWTLASDRKLLAYLQTFGDDLVLKTKSLQNDLDTLFFETRTAEINLNNCFTNLTMLSSKQFIENRVYDDEPEEETAKKEPSPEIIPKDEELVPKFTAALAAGLAALEYYSQPVSLDQIPRPGEDAVVEKPKKRKRRK